MENFSVAFNPESKDMEIKVYMNVKDIAGNLGVDDHLLFKKVISIPVNVWNLIVEINDRKE